MKQNPNKKYMGLNLLSAASAALRAAVFATPSVICACGQWKE